MAEEVDRALQREAVLLQQVQQLQQRLATLEMGLRWQIRQCSIRLDAFDRSLAFVQAAAIEFPVVQLHLPMQDADIAPERVQA